MFSTRDVIIRTLNPGVEKATLYNQLLNHWKFKQYKTLKYLKNEKNNHWNLNKKTEKDKVKYIV